jgi:7-cyano-7-deazaguanine synthase
MDRKEVVILFSGGLDSTILIYIARMLGLSPYCVIIDYGQTHIKEIEYAEIMCREMFVPYKIVKIELPVESKLTDGTIGNYENVSPFHVPARNLIFIGLAASIAESRKTDTIWYGANYEDREKFFPDCYQEWVYKMNELLKTNGSMEIKVYAPLLGMPKEVLWQLGEYFNIDKSKIFSGYGEQQ